MASSRTIVIAGAGIGGLTAAIALAKKGFRAVVCEQSAKLEETGAGIQLSPNATRLLNALGVGEKLKPSIVVPDALSIKQARSGWEIAHMPLGPAVEFRFGAPYWMVHRADLQSALLAVAQSHPDIVLRLGAKVEDFALHAHGVTAQVRQGTNAKEERALALVGADGLWSVVRRQLGGGAAPRFRQRTAWRATVPASTLGEEFRKPVIHLWLARNAHLVHYPLRGGQVINIVAIVRDKWREAGWSAPGMRGDLLEHFPAPAFAAPARSLLQAPQTWLKWALFDRPPIPRWGRGPITLVGDAAHPMLPFLAQGAGMAIEDAFVLAESLGAMPNDLTRGMRRYEGVRRRRTARVQRAAARTGRLYHLGGPLALARDLMLYEMGGDKLRERYDWLYDWRPR